MSVSTQISVCKFIFLKCSLKKHQKQQKNIGLYCRVKHVGLAYFIYIDIMALIYKIVWPSEMAWLFFTLLVNAVYSVSVVYHDCFASI